MNETLAAATEAAFGSEADDAMAVLMAYGEEPQDREPDWVRRAILTLATGDLSRLRHFAERAHQDYRDVLMWAESPRDPDEPQTYAELLERLAYRPTRTTPDR